MPRYAHKYIRQRELGKKAKRPLKHLHNHISHYGLYGRQFNWKNLAYGLLDKRQRLEYRIAMHRLLPRTPGVLSDIEKMRATLRDTESTLKELGYD